MTFTPFDSMDPDVSRNSHKELKQVGLPLVHVPLAQGIIGSSREDNRKQVDGNKVEFGQ